MRLVSRAILRMDSRVYKSKARPVVQLFSKVTPGIDVAMAGPSFPDATSA